MNNLKIEEILQSFYEISGMDIAIVNCRNKIIARRYSGAMYCSTIHKSIKCLETCIESDKCALCAAHEKEGLYVYKCPFGIYEALMPIYSNDEVVAYLFVGMGIEDIVENENELMTKALDMSPTLNKKLLEKSIEDVPKYSREKLDAYASLLPLISQYIETNNLLSDTDMTVGQLVKAYVKNNLSKKITLSELSWKLHCSTVTLTEHFKKEFGITIMEYVTQKRMDKAKRLLENSDLSVREISEACGFSDIEYFSRSFKGIYKMSPSAWRKTHSKVMASTVKRQRSEKKPIKAEEGSEKSEASTKNNAIAPPSSQESGSAEIEKNETEQEKAERLDKENMEKLFRQYGSCFE